MLEISRAVTIGQYIPNGSILNRLDPRVKIVALVVLIVLVSVANRFLALGALTLLALLLLALQRLPLGFVLTSLRAAFVFLLFIDVFQVVFYQGQQTHILWHAGFATISTEGLLFTARISLRVLLLYVFVNLLTYSTATVDLADGTEALLSPLQRIGVPVNEVVMVMVVALKFVPIFITELERAMRAHTARGVKLDSGNIISRTLKIGPLLIPLILSGLQRAEQLTIAMEARCYRGGRGRTKLRLLQFRPADLLAASIFAAACAAIVWINVMALV